MSLNQITVETTLHTDSEGREYLQFTPVLKARVIASGELRFAHWQAYLDEPENHAMQKANAFKTGKESLAAPLRPREWPRPRDLVCSLTPPSDSMKTQSVTAMKLTAALIRSLSPKCHYLPGFIARAQRAYRRNLADPGDCKGDLPMLAGLAVAEAEIGRGAGWIPAVQKRGYDLAKQIEAGSR